MFLDNGFNFPLHVCNECHDLLGTENHIFFLKMSCKDGFPQKMHWNMIFLVLSGKMIFLFPENMILFFRRKMKDDFSQKNTWKYDIFSKCSGKMVFPNKTHWNMIFFFRRKMKYHISQKIHGELIFSVYSVKIVFLFPTNIILPSVKKAKMIFYQKIHLKMTLAVSLKKMIFILENMVFLLTEKVKFNKV